MPKTKATAQSGTAPEESVKNLTKRELVMAISDKTGIIQQDVSKVMQLTLDGIIDALESGHRIEFRDFGVFEIVVRKARIGRNPNKPQETVDIPAHKSVKFKPGKRMRQIMQPRKAAAKAKGKRKGKGSAK